MITLEQFISQHPSGSYINDDGTLGPNTPGGQAQCVNLANAWCAALGIEQFPGNAANFEFLSHPDCDWIANTPTNAPPAGAIVVWHVSPNLPLGHVDVAEGGATAQSFNGYDQNWPLGSPCHSQQHDYNGVAGWLVPRVLEAPPAPQPSPIHWGRFSGVIDVAAANVRAGWSTGERVLYQVPRGTTLGFDGYVHSGTAIPDAVTGQPDDRWFHIISDAREGWIASAVVNGNPSF